MADGELTLKLDDDTARRLKDEADAAGLSVEAYAAELLAWRLRSGDDWSEDERIVAEAEGSGVTYSLEEGMAAFDAALEVQLEKTRDAAGRALGASQG